MANLVGILVILIMVIGVRARNAWHSTTNTPPMSTAAATLAPRERPEANEALQRDVDARQSAVEELQRDAFRLDHEIQQVAAQAASKRNERDQLQLLVSAAEADLKQRTDALGADDREKLQLDQSLAAAQRELEELLNTIDAVEQSLSANPKQLRHYPTPLAKTVFGREEHFRLMGRRLVYVPINDIVAHLRSDAENKLWKLKDADEITETIGPYGGFRVRYTMQRRERRVRTQSGMNLHRTIELARFRLFPVADTMGEPLEAALSSDSEFLKFVRTLDPNDTTITVWTYPDSFADFRQLKDLLREMGFLAAARPMPHGHPIGGSPDGSRSAAE